LKLVKNIWNDPVIAGVIAGIILLFITPLILPTINKIFQTAQITTISENSKIGVKVIDADSGKRLTDFEYILINKLSKTPYFLNKKAYFYKLNGKSKKTNKYFLTGKVRSKVIESKTIDKAQIVTSTFFFTLSLTDQNNTIIINHSDQFSMAGTSAKNSLSNGYEKILEYWN
jgi:hypothetical protein